MAVSKDGVLTAAQHEGTYRRNFFAFLGDGILFTIAFNLISSNTVVPEFIGRLTDSQLLIGLSGSLFEICWLLPQLFVARYLVQVTRKKWWFVGPNIPVRFAMVVCGVVVYLLGPEPLNLLLFTFLICYVVLSLGDGLVGVPWVDLIGNSMDDKWRARFFGMMTGIGSLIVLIISPLIRKVLNADSGTLAFPNNYALLFFVSGSLFAMSIIPTLFIKELPSGKESETVPSFREFIPALGQVLRKDRQFTAMIVTRMLTSLFMMAGPFYVGFATNRLGLPSGTAVANLLAMQTIGAMTGALIYAWMGRRYNLLYIRLALALAALLPISGLVANVAGPIPLYVGFFASGVALSNLFNSYLNWVIMHVRPEQRTIYTGLFNTISAVTLFISPLIGGSIVQAVGYQPVFVVALAMVAIAIFVVTQFVDVPQSQDGEVAA